MGKVRREGVNPLFFNTKKNKKTFQKGIDKYVVLWYNNNAEGKRDNNQSSHHHQPKERKRIKK
jgi:hypothetical protein